MIYIIKEHEVLYHNLYRLKWEKHIVLLGSKYFFSVEYLSPYPLQRWNIFVPVWNHRKCLT